MLKLTSFQSPPDIFVHVEDARGMEVSSLSIIGATEATMSLTIHIRDPEAEDPYEVKLTVSYEEQGTVDERIVPLSLTRGEQLG